MRPYLLILLLCKLIGCGGESPSPKTNMQVTDKPNNSSSASTLPQAVNVPNFSGTGAFEYLVQQTSFGPRNPNSKGHEQCLAFLEKTLRQSADEVQLQSFTSQGYDESLNLTNVIAKFNPAATARVLLCAHWDTRPRAEEDTNKTKRNQPIPGANDGASGVAVLLEIARLLKQQPPAVGVDLVFFDGEDYGMESDLSRYFLGSRYFAKTKSSDYNPRFGILLDMVGDKFLDIPKEQHSVKFAPDIVDLVWSKAKELGYPQFVDEVGEEVNDDHLQLNEVGIKTIDLIDFNYPDQTNRYWHTHDDTPDKCSAESLEAVGAVLTHIVYGQLP